MENSLDDKYFSNDAKESNVPESIKYKIIKSNNLIIDYDASSYIIEKRPPFTFKNGAIYEGEWKGKIRVGFGTQFWPDGAKYEGEWKNNKAEGKGKFWHVDGDVYEGMKFFAKYLDLF